MSRPKVKLLRGGATIQVSSGGLIDIETGGDIKYNGDSLIAELAALSGLDSGELGVLNSVTVGAWAASKACTLDASKVATLPEACNFVLGTATGTKLGTAVGQKLGLWGATPIVQPASANQAVLALDVDVTGGDTVDKAAVDANFAAIQTLVNQLRTDLINVGIIKGAA